MLSTTSRTLKRCLGTTLFRMKHTLPDLKYDFHALEPYISADIMKLHYEKHHQAYVNNLNVAEEKLNAALAKGDINAVVSLQQAIKFNGGGHINHTIFWSNLSPKGGGEPAGDLMQQIKDEYSTFENMKKILAEKSVAIQGSGWGWLGYDKTTGKLHITTCSNQDPLEGTTGLTPLFGIDVWEHAYYLQYKNVRADYVNAIFHIANWKDVSDRLAAARLKN